MTNLGITGLPDLVNALLITSIFSAGNTYTYAATRSLYGLALEGRAPRFLAKTTKKGIPVFAFGVTMCFPFLSFLSLSDSSSKVITWLVDIITAGALINYMVICITFLQFYKACKAQGLDRKTLPYTGRFQPYSAWIGLVFMIVICLFYGYTAFGPPSVDAFWQNYTMQVAAPILYFGWKLIKRTKWKKPSEVDLVWEAPLVDAYEATFVNKPLGFWVEMGQLIGIRRGLKDERIGG